MIIDDDINKVNLQLIIKNIENEINIKSKILIDSNKKIENYIKHENTTNIKTLIEIS